MTESLEEQAKRNAQLQRDLERAKTRKTNEMYDRVKSLTGSKPIAEMTTEELVKHNREGMAIIKAREAAAKAARIKASNASMHKAPSAMQVKAIQKLRETKRAEHEAKLNQTAEYRKKLGESVKTAEEVAKPAQSKESPIKASKSVEHKKPTATQKKAYKNMVNNHKKPRKGFLVAVSMAVGNVLAAGRDKIVNYCKKKFDEYKKNKPARDLKKAKEETKKIVAENVKLRKEVKKLQKTVGKADRTSGKNSVTPYPTPQVKGKGVSKSEHTH